MLGCPDGRGPPKAYVQKFATSVLRLPCSQQFGSTPLPWTWSPNGSDGHFGGVRTDAPRQLFLSCAFPPCARRGHPGSYGTPVKTRNLRPRTRFSTMAWRMRRVEGYCPAIGRCLG